MYYPKSLALVGVALAAPTATDAFALISPSTASSRPHSTLGATKDPNNERDTFRNIAAVSALTLGMLFPSTNALAAQDLPLHALHSSTVELSATIRTMDFSMPSSYDSISDPLASAGNKEELTKDEEVPTAGPKRVKKVADSGLTPKEAAAAKRAEAVANRKTQDSGLSAKESSEAARAAKVANRLANEAEQAARDEKALLERDANIKAAREEKIAKREAAKEEQAAADAEKEDAKFKDAKFVDTSMPSY